jgi:hypothetical protein
MQVTLNIDANLAGSVAEVFAQLKPEDKRSLALAIMEKFLSEPHTLERAAFEAEVISDIRDRNEEIWTSGYGRRLASACNEAEIRGSSDFRDRLAKYKSTRERMVEAITGAAIDSYRAAAKSLVESDTQIEKVKGEVLEQIRQDFPKYVHDAMAAWFVQGLVNMKDGMMQALMQAHTNEAFRNSVTEKLRLNG